MSKKANHELTEKFREKKERIHAFYAPQLENRKQEVKNAEVLVDEWVEDAENWRRMYFELCRKQSQPVCDRTPTEKEKLLTEAFKSVDEQRIEFAKANQELRDRVEELEDELQKARPSGRWADDTIKNQEKEIAGLYDQVLKIREITEEALG